MGWRVTAFSGCVGCIIGLSGGVFLGAMIHKEDMAKESEALNVVVDAISKSQEDFFSTAEPFEDIWSYRTVIHPITDVVTTYAIKKSMFKDQNGKPYELSPMYKTTRNSDGYVKTQSYLTSHDLEFCHGNSTCTTPVKMNGHFTADVTFTVGDSKNEVHMFYPITERNKNLPLYTEILSVELSNNRFPVLDWTNFNGITNLKAFEAGENKVKLNKKNKENS